MTTTKAIIAECAELLNVHEVAQLLTVSVRTVWSWTYDGRLAAVRLSDRVTRWRRSDVLQFIEQQRTAN